MRDTLQRISWRLEGWLVPGLGGAHQVYERTLERYVGAETRWLDLGCGHQLLPPWRRELSHRLARTCRLVCGIDADGASLTQNTDISRRVRGDILRLPFRESQFDLVSANMVVEHIPQPARLWAEVGRVLRPGGVFVFQTPNLLGYATLAARLIPRRLRPRLAAFLDGRREADVFPTWYRANRPGTIRRLAQAAGLRVRELSLLVSPPLCVMLPPVLLLELVWMRLLSGRGLRDLRTRIVAVLEKAADGAGAGGREAGDRPGQRDHEPALAAQAR